MKATGPFAHSGMLRFVVEPTASLRLSEALICSAFLLFVFFRIFRRRSGNTTTKPPNFPKTYCGHVSFGPLVQEECDPWVAKDHVGGKPCGSHCPATSSNSFAVDTTSISFVRYTTPAETEANIQWQILARGGIISCFEHYNDFSGDGVYIKSASARRTSGGGHAVVTIGWGVDNGVKYWLVENS